MSIPEKAVEEALKAHLAHKAVRSPGNAKNAMRAALEAATPIIAAKAWDEGAESCIWEAGNIPYHPENPYKEPLAMSWEVRRSTRMSNKETQTAGAMAIAMAELARRSIGPDGTVIRVPSEDSPILRSAFIAKLAEAAMAILDEKSEAP